MRRYSDTDVYYEALNFVWMNKSLRAVAKFLRLPQSTLHWHLTVRLPLIDKDLSDQASAILKEHRRG